jgi:hypothetical protein
MKPHWVGWIVSSVLALFGAWIIIFNYATVIRWYRHRAASSRRRAAPPYDG